MKDRDAELRAEIQSHLEIAVADRVARGETPDAAAARGNFEAWFPSVTQPMWREIQMHRGGFAGLFAWGRAGFSLSEGGEARTAEGPD